MLGEFLYFYRDLYRSKFAKLPEEYLDGMPLMYLVKEQRKFLDFPIMVEELGDVVDLLQTKKAPGN